MEDRQNRRQLLTFWLPTIGIVGLLVVGAFYQAQRWGVNYLIPLLLSLIVLIGFIVYRSRSMRRTTERLFRSETPEPLISYYSSRPGSVLLPHRDAQLACTRSQIYTYYGEFARARDELQSVDWSDVPSSLRSQQYYAQALLAYLEAHNIQQGLHLAREARRLLEGARLFSGASTTARSYDRCIAIGQALSGNHREAVVEKLEQELPQAPIFSKIIVLWGLEIVYAQMGQLERAHASEMKLKQLAPFCRGVIDYHMPGRRANIAG